MGGVSGCVGDSAFGAVGRRGGGRVRKLCTGEVRDDSQRHRDASVAGQCVCKDPRDVVDLLGAGAQGGVQLR